MLVRREGSGSIPLLEPAERNVIGGVRIGGFVLGDEDEMRQRIAGMTVVEEKETQRVMRPNVLGRNCENALEKLLRLDRIAVALTVQRGNRKVDADQSVEAAADARMFRPPDRSRTGPSARRRGYSARRSRRLRRWDDDDSGPSILPRTERSDNDGTGNKRLIPRRRRPRCTVACAPRWLSQKRRE